MVKNYMKRSLMLLGASAVVFGASAGSFVDVTNKYLKEPCYMPGWQGVISSVNAGVGEVWNGAFRAYQILPDMPAGEYTLTANALYRCGNNDFSQANMKGAETTPELYNAYLFLGDAKQTVKGKYDEPEGLVPNNQWEAADAFAAGKYVNTVKVNHKGGDLVFGIYNTGCYDDEWCAFTNFKLEGPSGPITIENGDFSTGIDPLRAWNNVSTENKEKTPDMQKDGAGGGDYRKCGGSPYKYGQQVELPAGKYRFGMLTFHRYGSTVTPEGKYFHHKSGDDTEAYGRIPRTPADWFKANDYESQDTYDHAYLFMSKGADCPKDLNWSEDMGDLDEATDLRTRIKDCWELCNGDYESMPDNNPYGKDATLPYETKNKCINWHDSGNEREAAAAFVAEPEKYYQYVEFELAEPTKVWLGMGKNTNTSDGYWHAWADQTLKMYDENAGSSVSEIVVDENAPVEYYNLQGVRVAAPENGIFIVKQGKKVAKQIFK